MLRRVLWPPVRDRQLKLLNQRRFLATEVHNETSLIRNMALVAHIGAFIRPAKVAAHKHI
jgi:elongation factor G